MNRKIKIGITIGDPSGVGPEITLKALKDFNYYKDCEIIVFGDKIALTKNGFGKNDLKKFNLIDLNKINEHEFRFGKLDKKFGLASFSYLEKSVSYLKNKEIDCLVTAPVNKEAIAQNNINFYGHTEFLAENFGVKDFVMMFVSKKLKLSLVTRHIALKDVPKNITKENIYWTIKLTQDALTKYFGIKNPKIAVCGLNPHASEEGLIGNEENEIIKPVISKIKEELSNAVDGPLPADSVFNRALNKEFDAVVSMYHDQGLTAFKMLYFNEGVNLTLGLPFMRTSPTGGTAFDIAGKNKANYNSMLEAINLAYKLTKNKLRK